MATGDQTLTGEILTPEVDPNSNQERDYLADLVGEGKKYATVEEAARNLAKKAVHADEFIETLKTEKSQVLSELTEVKAKAKTAEELLLLLKENPGTHTLNPGGEQDQQAAAPLTKEEIVAVTQEVLRKAEGENLKKQQFEQAKAILNSEEGFGSAATAAKMIKQFIEKDPSNKVLVDSIGVTNPKRLVQLVKMEIGEPEPFSRERDTTFVPTQVQSNDLTWDKAQKIKRENPTLYNSVGFQKKLLQAIDKNPNFNTRK